MRGVDGRSVPPVVGPTVPGEPVDAEVHAQHQFGHGVEPDPWDTTADCAEHALDVDLGAELLGVAEIGLRPASGAVGHAQDGAGGGPPVRPGVGTGMAFVDLGGEPSVALSVSHDRVGPDRPRALRPIRGRCSPR